MVGLLSPFSTVGTARFHVVDGLTRAEFLEHPERVPGDSADAWWRLARPAR